MDDVLCTENWTKIQSYQFSTPYSISNSQIIWYQLWSLNTNEKVALSPPPNLCPPPYFYLPSFGPLFLARPGHATGGPPPYRQSPILNQNLILKLLPLFKSLQNFSPVPNPNPNLIPIRPPSIINGVQCSSRTIPIFFNWTVLYKETKHWWCSEILETIKFQGHVSIGLLKGGFIFIRLSCKKISTMFGPTTFGR